MKIVVGVGETDRYKNTVNLISRLEFEQLSLVMAHSVNLIPVMAGFGAPEVVPVAVESMDILSNEGQDSLNSAMEWVAPRYIDSRKMLLSGQPAAALIDLAVEVNADIVAVHASQKGMADSILLGSCSKDLAIHCEKSVLITKGLISPEGLLNVVFATDFSEYSKRALDKFIAMKISGIEKLTVVSAVRFPSIGAGFFASEEPGSKSSESLLTPEAEIEKREELQKLTDAGYVVSEMILEQAVNDAIRKCMAETKADLLVMGAKGHGFVRRVLLGSVAMHQAEQEPYSVLIIRP